MRIVNKIPILIFFLINCFSINSQELKPIEEETNFIIESFLWDQLRIEMKMGNDSLKYEIKSDQWFSDFFKRKGYETYLENQLNKDHNKSFNVNNDFFKDTEISFYIKQLEEREEINVNTEELKRFRLIYFPPVKNRRYRIRGRKIVITKPVYSRDKKTAILYCNTPNSTVLFIYRKNDHIYGWYVNSFRILSFHTE